eukprot:c32678_g1_i1 orf=166-315(-)
MQSKFVFNVCRAALHVFVQKSIDIFVSYLPPHIHTLAPIDRRTQKIMST